MHVQTLGAIGRSSAVAEDRTIVDEHVHVTRARDTSTWTLDGEERGTQFHWLRRLFVAVSGLVLGVLLPSHKASVWYGFLIALR